MQFDEGLVTASGPQSFPIRRGPHLPFTLVTETACYHGQSGSGGLKSGVMAGLTRLPKLE